MLILYWTTLYTLIAFSGSYHGQTSGALALSSGRDFKQEYLPLIPGVHFTPYPYTYRCPFGNRDPHHDCAAHCVQYLADVLSDPYSGITKPAAIIVEPIQGEGGVIVPPDDFLSELHRLADEEEVPLIVDEIQTGFGRTGKMFACEHSGVTPDIMTMAKSLGGIGFPLSGCLYRKELDTWEPGGHVGTFRGHLVAMAAGTAAIEFIQENDLVAHAARLGESMLKQLHQLQEEVEYIGEVRGKGLFIAVELVKDRESKEPYPELVKEIQRRCYEKGLLIWSAGHYGNAIRIMPPLVITEELAFRGMEILAQTMRELLKEV